MTGIIAVNPTPRIILHADMDCFYAGLSRCTTTRSMQPYRSWSVPIPRGTGRGVVSTCSYEARAYGIRSAMPISHAYRLCPDAIFLRPRMIRYGEVSEEIMTILDSPGFRFEQVSIDEAFLDLSPCPAVFRRHGNWQKS